ncbi:MAG: T9SS type A sorting domain-containing protein [bacterium]
MRFSKLLLTVIACGAFAVTSSHAQTQDALRHPKLVPAVTAKGFPTSAKHNTKPLGQLDVYDHGDPTAEEQYELELINRARSNPPAEGLLLFNTQNPYLVNSLQQWGSPTRADVKSAFAGYPARQPLAFNKNIIAAARIHSQDMLDHNYQAHDSPTDGSSPFTRMQKAGYTNYTYAGENIFAYGSDLDEINMEFEYDFGNPGLGHRENLINFGTYTYAEIGIGIIHGGSGNGNVGPIITTEDFGTIPGNIFITGVVYGDDNHNNFYDVGEGLPGVTITASNGWTAVSSTSGGYAIPVTVGEGTVTVTASGGPLTADIVHQASIDQFNVKVDFIQGSTGFPDQPIGIYPISDTVVHADTATITWGKIAGTTKYQLLVSTSNDFSKPLVKDSTLTGGTKLLKTLTDGTTYYWKVRAKNAIGWGQYSATFSFSIGLPLKAPVLTSPADGANIGTADADLKWVETTPQANDYWIEVTKDNTFATTFRSDTIFTNEFSISATDLEAGATYFWRVRAENDNGFSAPSVGRKFTAGASGVASSNTSTFNLSVTPNPTRNEAHVNFTLRKSAVAQLKIYDVTGKVETSINLGNLAPKAYDITWETGNKPAGVYLYELTIGDTRTTGNIVVVK